MSEINHDQFEAWINRYLDGELTDDEFEQYLRSIDAGLDLEKLRLLRTRIERIEELYRQIEEPAVPHGYWDEFADRVTARISPETRPSLKDSILTLFLPSRWPNATYRYAGAVASVLIVFLIGKSLMKSGSDEYMPHDYPAVQVEEFPPSSGKSISIEEAGEEKRDVTETAKPEPEQVVEHAEQPIDESEPVQPTEDAIEIFRAEKDVMELSKPTSNVVISVEQPIDESEPVKPAADVVQRVRAKKDIMEMSKPTSNVTISSEQTHTMPVQNVDEILATSVGAERMQLHDMDDSEGNYDSWDLDSLRAQFSLYEKLLADSLYADSAFIDFAKIKSSIAFITRDSTDICDAISAIDSLLIHNSDADPQRWTQRRANLTRILENLNNR